MKVVEPTDTLSQASITSHIVAKRLVKVSARKGSSAPAPSRCSFAGAHCNASSSSSISSMGQQQQQR